VINRYKPIGDVVRSLLTIGTQNQRQLIAQHVPKILSFKISKSGPILKLV